jgi:hypothetical protein
VDRDEHTNNDTVSNAHDDAIRNADAYADKYSDLYVHTDADGNSYGYAHPDTY